MVAVGVVVAGLMPTPTPAAATVRHVSAGGADSAVCSQASPCATLARAYATAVAGDVVHVAAGLYPAQRVPAGTKAVTFRGAAGARLRELDNFADNVTFDGIEVDAQFAKVSGFENHGAANVTFQNGRIGNVTDEKGAVVSGTNFTFDNVVFHDVRLIDPNVHNECVYAIVVPGMTVRNSTFQACATMDLFFTYGDWWTPLPPAYGGVTLENNVFAHSMMEQSDPSWHYYSLSVGNTAHGGGTLKDWTVRNNTFEIPAAVSRESSSGSRWVGNLGSWDCVAGVEYRHNVGTRCSSTDKAITPAASTRTRVAPFGWVDPALNDFRLRAGSTAIGAADPGDAPATDRDGHPRDSRPDAGAYEFGAGDTAATGPPTATGSRSPIRVRAARLGRDSICVSARARCPSTTKLLVRLSAPGRVTARIQRLRRRAAPRTVRTIKLPARTTHAARVTAGGLAAGRYRIVVVANDTAGRRSRSKTISLRVR